MQQWTPSDLQANLDKGASVFLKLWKKGCGACKLSTPAIERIEAEDSRSLTFAQISTDDHPEMLELSESEVLPVFFIFADGKMLGRLEGFKGLERLKQFVNEAWNRKGE
jgi:thioredoxin-like negative regulator of GroEL